MNALKKIGCTVMAILTVSTCAVTATVSDSPIAKNFSIVNVIDASAESQSIRLYNQLDNKWNNEYNLKNSGCGIFSFCNAIYALNGYKPNPNTVAKWALSKNAYNKDLGLYRDVFYSNVQSKYGSKYDFKVSTKKYANVEDTTLINALKNKKKVAVAHVKNHFIAIVNYRVRNNTKEYLVIESAVSNTRGLSATGWVSANKLKSGNTKVDWFVVLQSTKADDKANEQGERRNIKTKYFPKYVGNSDSIIVGLNSVGACSSFNYRKKIAEFNDISTYVGKAYQDITMLALLKQGKLKDPAWKG